MQSKKVRKVGSFAVIMIGKILLMKFYDAASSNLKKGKLSKRNIGIGIFAVELVNTYDYRFLSGEPPPYSPSESY